MDIMSQLSWIKYIGNKQMIKVIFSWTIYIFPTLLIEFWLKKYVSVSFERNQHCHRGISSDKKPGMWFKTNVIIWNMNKVMTSISSMVEIFMECNAIGYIISKRMGKPNTHTHKTTELAVSLTSTILPMKRRCEITWYNKNRIGRWRPRWQPRWLENSTYLHHIVNVYSQNKLSQGLV